MASRKAPPSPAPSGQERERRREGKKGRRASRRKKGQERENNSGVLVMRTQIPKFIRCSLWEPGS